MSVGSIIKQNRVLVAGIILPLILIGLLALAKSFPDKVVDPPQYRLIFWTKNWSGMGNLSARVNEQSQLTISYVPNQGYKPTNNEPLPKATIFIYTPATNRVDEYQVTAPANADASTAPIPVAMPSLDNLKISSQALSPDGYSFEPYHYRGSGLITEIFIGGSRSYGPSLVKAGRMIELPKSSTYYTSPEFIGWITEGAVR